MAVEPYMEITEQLTELPAWDFSIAGFRGDDLIIAGGTDGPISPERASVTLHFINVSYIECPMEFSHAGIRLASEAERSYLNKRCAVDTGMFCYVIEAETMGSVLETQAFLIVAEGLEIE